MSVFDLNLPRDIPWERIGTTIGMIDRVSSTPDGAGVVYRRTTPNVWKPSLSIFAYVVPEEDSKDYPKRRIIYLKIPVTLTGIRPTIVRQPVDNIVEPTEGLTTEFEESTPYLACYGALIHVAVYPVPVPKDQSWKGYPYIIDMEPKRREVLQAVTDSQQYLEGAMNKLAFGKSVASETSTQAGFNFGAKGGGSYEGVSGSVQGGYNTSTAVTDRVGSRTDIDWSKEKRESFSYTTQINQIYQVQISYHLGSNRVFLAIQPRPGLDNSEFLIVNGPRRIEGIQDFVLTVNAPDDLKGICVHAKVESAHIYEPYTDTPPETGTLLIVSNEANGCLPLKKPEEMPKVRLDVSGMEKFGRPAKPGPGLDKPILERDIMVELEKPIPPIPPRDPRARPMDMMARYNHYIEDSVIRPMLNSVGSTERYAKAIPFASTRAAAEGLKALIAKLPANDPRNVPVESLAELDRSTRTKLRTAGIKRLADLFKAPAGRGKLQPASDLLAKAREQIIDRFR